MGVRARGFTLIELLVVMLIIGLVSIFVIPPVVHSIAERGTRESASLVQAAVVGARDEAIHANAPRGFRLLLDPAFPAVNAAGTGIDPMKPLVSNRWIPLTTAPDYSEGKLDIYSPALHTWTVGNPPPFPRPIGNAPYAWWPVRGFNPPYLSLGKSITPTVLCVVEAVKDRTDPTVIHSPASWFWNVRIGDKLRIGDSTVPLTVVGPYTRPNPEGFINDGPSGVPSQLTHLYPDGTQPPVQYMFLANGIDDDGDGFGDNGWDGIDNNRNGLVDELDEWETEKFTASYTGRNNSSLGYTIRRRAVPAPGTREVSLPSGVVIDLTTWATTRERSRLPIDPVTGTVNVMVQPDGTVYFDSPYGVPTRQGLDSSFLHFWLTDRSDVAAPVAVAGQPLTLPIPTGNRVLATVQARTGRFSSGPVETFDPILDPANGHYGADTPFMASQQGTP